MANFRTQGPSALFGPRENFRLGAPQRRPGLSVFGAAALCAALAATILLAGCDVYSPNLGVAPTPSSTLSSIYPSSAFAGSGAFTLTVNGAGFVSGSVVLWNNQVRVTTFINSSQLTAAILAADVAASKVASVGVQSPATGGNANAGNNLSNVFLPFIINPADNPAPNLSGLMPPSATAGTAGVTLTITGTQFVSGATVLWNSQNCTNNPAPPSAQVCIATTFVSSTQLTAQIPAGFVPALVPVSQPLITVFNPAPGGGSSNSLIFTITGTQGQGAVNRSRATLGALHSPSITSGPRFVAFVAPATDTATSGSAGAADTQEVFLQDTCTGASAACTPQTTLVSVPLFGPAPDGDSSLPSISADGRFVAFVSSATNLVADDHNGVADVFLRDTCTGAPAGCSPATTRLSIGPNGLEANGQSVSASISSDGRYVAFDSEATNLVLDGSWGLSPASIASSFLRDTCFGAPAGCTPATTRLTVASPAANSTP